MKLSPARDMSLKRLILKGEILNGLQSQKHGELQILFGR